MDTPQAGTRNQRDVLARVLSDDSQIALIPIAGLTGDAADFKVFDSIFLFKNLDAVNTYTNSIEGKRLLDELRKYGLQGLGFVHGGMVQLASRRPLSGARDLRGLKVGTPNTIGETAKQLAGLGATSVPLPFAETSVALNAGEVDAIELGWPALAQVARDNTDWSVLESNHRYRGYVLVANSAAFESLSKSARVQILADAQSVIASHNEKIISDERVARAVVIPRMKTVSELTRSDYNRMISQLAKPSGDSWNATGAQRKTMAAALTVSDASLARRYFGEAAPSVPPQRAPQLAQSSPSPVYNINLSPRSISDQVDPLLHAGGRTTLRFDIGPRREDSVIASQSPAREILQSPSDIRLTVILFCSFCESTDDELLKQTTYRPTEGRSDEVRFTFIPKKRPDGAPYRGTLQLTVLNDSTGRPFDRINVDVSIEGTFSPTASGADTTVVVVPSGAIADNNRKEDITLYAMARQGKTVTLEFEAHTDPMKQLLNSIARDAQGSRRVFRTGIDSPKLVEAMTNSAYGTMSALSQQGDFLKRLSVRGDDAVVSEDSQKKLHLTDDESRKVAQVIADVGQTLYRELITWSEEADLERLIKLLEEAGEQAAKAGKPLRIKVQTDISLPWQYLHPTGVPTDPYKFWGLKFILSVERFNDRARLPSNFPVNSQARKIAFARYTPSADESVPLALEQIEQLRQLPTPKPNLIPVESGAELKDALKLHRKELSAIITFLHASAGGPDTEPNLQFDKGDLVDAKTLDVLLNSLPGDELRTMRYLTGAPLVILNACETGPSRQLPYKSLQDVMTKLGARGIVMTEVSVWMSLGHAVGTRLIDRLGKGEPVADALTAIRRELYEKDKNPLGLLYNYYGDPAATLLRN